MQELYTVYIGEFHIFFLSFDDGFYTTISNWNDQTNMLDLLLGLHPGHTSFPAEPCSEWIQALFHKGFH